MQNRMRTWVLFAFFPPFFHSCQVEMPAGTPSIYGGRKPQPGTPETLSTAALLDGEGLAACTGTLVSPQIVITAGHCIDPSPEAVGFGPKMEGVTKVRHVVVRGRSFDSNDLAVIILDSPAPKPYVPTPILPSPNPIKTGSSVTLSGYGWSSWERGGDVLRSVEKVVKGFVEGGKVITFNQRDGRGACHGDSGGPAYVKIHGRWYVIGATSGPIDAGEQEPDCNRVTVGYTYLPAHLNWIKEKSRGLYRELDADSELHLDCPKGYTWNGKSPYCTGKNRDGVLNAVGLFPTTLQDRCDEFKGGSGCRELQIMQFSDGVNVSMLRYSESVVRRSITPEGCLGGSARDASYFNLCRDETYGYGPFSKDLIEFCTNRAKGGAACRTNRLSLKIIESFAKNK